MNLSELTDKIYAEGVEKGNQEAQRILDEANAKAAQIVAKAEKEAADKLAKAEKKAQELDAHTKAELKLYTEQALNALKTAVVDLLNGEIVPCRSFHSGIRFAERLHPDGIRSRTHGSRRGYAPFS